MREVGNAQGTLEKSFRHKELGHSTFSFFTLFWGRQQVVSQILRKNRRKRIILGFLSFFARTAEPVFSTLAIKSGFGIGPISSSWERGERGKGEEGHCIEFFPFPKFFLPRHARFGMQHMSVIGSGTRKKLTKKSPRKGEEGGEGGRLGGESN